MYLSIENVTQDMGLVTVTKTIYNIHHTYNNTPNLEDLMEGTLSQLSKEYTRES